MGREFEFINIAAAMAKFLQIVVKQHSNAKPAEMTYLCDGLRRNNRPRKYATNIETTVTMTKKIGMAHSSLSLAVQGMIVA